MQKVFLLALAIYLSWFALLIQADVLWSNETVNVGVLYHRSGAQASERAWVENVVKYAQKDMAIQYPHTTIKMELIDDRSSVAFVASIVRDLLWQGRVSAFVGPFTSAGVEAVRALEEIKNGAKALFVSPFSTAPALRHKDNILRTVTSDIHEVRALAMAVAHDADPARDLRTFILHRNDVFGRSYVDTIRDMFSKTVATNTIHAFEYHAEGLKDKITADMLPFRQALAGVSASERLVVSLVGFDEVGDVMEHLAETLDGIGATRAASASWYISSGSHGMAVPDLSAAVFGRDVFLMAPWSGYLKNRTADFVSQVGSHGAISPYAYGLYDAIVLATEATLAGIVGEPTHHAVHLSGRLSGMTRQMGLDANGDRARGSYDLIRLNLGGADDGHVKINCTDPANFGLLAYPNDHVGCQVAARVGPLAHAPDDDVSFISNEPTPMPVHVHMAPSFVGSHVKPKSASAAEATVVSPNATAVVVVHAHPLVYSTHEIVTEDPNGANPVHVTRVRINPHPQRPIHFHGRLPFHRPVPHFRSSLVDQDHEVLDDDADSVLYEDAVKETGHFEPQGLAMFVDMGDTDVQAHRVRATDNALGLSAYDGLARHCKLADYNVHHEPCTDAQLLTTVCQHESVSALRLMLQVDYTPYGVLGAEASAQLEYVATRMADACADWNTSTSSPVGAATTQNVLSTMLQEMQGAVTIAESAGA